MLYGLRIVFLDSGPAVFLFFCGEGAGKDLILLFFFTGSHCFLQVSFWLGLLRIFKAPRCLFPFIMSFCFFVCLIIFVAGISIKLQERASKTTMTLKYRCSLKKCGVFVNASFQRIIIINGIVFFLYYACTFFILRIKSC